MAIDFSQVKTITIPEGSVTKITDSTGNILWQGVQSEGWHTIWEGNKTCSLTKNGTDDYVVSGEEQNFAQTVAGTGYTPKIRITFSYSNTNGGANNWNTEFNINNSFQTTPIFSPVTIDAVKKPLFGDTNLCLVVCRYYEGNAAKAILGVGLKSKSDTTNNSINISLKRQTGGTTAVNGYFTITFTITKIEQYYE